MEQKDFFIPTMGDLWDTSDLTVTEETLNNNIKLSDFGSGVNRISFYLLTYTGIAEGDIPEFSSVFDLSKYGNGVRKLFFEAAFLEGPRLLYLTGPGSKKTNADCIFQ